MNRATSSNILNATQTRQEVDRRLKTLYSDKVELAKSIDPIYGQLLQEMGEFISRGGKRLRPYLVYLAYAGYGGEDFEAIMSVAISQELYHNFLLVHDDIIDRDTRRYGGPNITGRYVEPLGRRLDEAEARHFAEGMAVMAGDINCGLAFESILNSSFDDGLKVKAAQRMVKMIFEVAGGEVLDVLLPFEEEDNIHVDRLTQVLMYKTATYSFASPLQLGGLLAGVSDDELARINHFALPIGMAFQLTDDLLGMFGDEAATGKPTISDLKEGKRTILMSYGLAMATKSEQKTLQHWLGNPAVDQEAHVEVKTILETCGAHAKTQALAARYATEAGKALQHTGLSAQAKEILTDIMAFTVSRNR